MDKRHSSLGPRVYPGESMQLRIEINTSEAYRQMWQDLGLDPEALDAIFSALRQGYRQEFLSGKSDPMVWPIWV